MPDGSALSGLSEAVKEQAIGGVATASKQQITSFATVVLPQAPQNAPSAEKPVAVGPRIIDSIHSVVGLTQLVSYKLPENTPEEQAKIADLTNKLKAEGKKSNPNHAAYVRTFTEAHLPPVKSVTQQRNEQFEQIEQQKKAQIAANTQQQDNDLAMRRAQMRTEAKQGLRG